MADTETECAGDRAMAVAIAKDVLERIAARTIKLEVGSYLGFRLGGIRKMSDSLREPLAGADLKDVVDDVEKVCEVCLLGACLLSKARLFDDVPLDRIGSGPVGGDKRVVRITYLTAGRGTVTDVLRVAFDRDQMTMMETAFEMDVWFCRRNDIGDKIALASALFAIDHLDPYERVKKVMENVIANGGLFVPGDPPPGWDTPQGRFDLENRILKQRGRDHARREALHEAECEAHYAD